MRSSHRLCYRSRHPLGEIVHRNTKRAHIALDKKRGLFGEVSPSAQTVANINDFMAEEGLLEASLDSIWDAICEARHTSENETFPDDASDNSLNDTSDDRTSVDTEVDKDADELDEEEELEDLEAEEIANIQDEDVVEGWISVSYINTC
jgi:hypothetical protein